MTESNRRFTTDSNLSEQTFESTVSDAVGFIKEMHDNDEATVTRGDE